MLSHQSIYSLKIKNISDECVRENGYDLRICGEKYYMVNGEVIIPDKKASLIEFQFNDHAEMEPLKTYLFESCEEIQMPSDTAGIMTLRSTLARNGFLTSPTVIDAGYKGKITIALTSLNKAKIKKGSRVIHLIFIKLDKPTEMLYNGSYQGGKII